MKKLLNITLLISILFIYACTSNKNEKNDESLIEEISVTNIDMKDTLFSDDSLYIILHNIDYTFSLILKKDDKIRIYDLQKLNIPAKVPMELNWHNDHFTCITTFYSGSYNNIIFIPNNINKEVISYHPFDIKETDSINNNIVYTDTVNKDQYIAYKVENLISKKSVNFQIPINSNNTIYPFYYKIEMDKDYVYVETNEKEMWIDIGGIY